MPAPKAKAAAGKAAPVAKAPFQGTAATASSSGSAAAASAAPPSGRVGPRQFGLKRGRRNIDTVALKKARRRARHLQTLPASSAAEVQRRQHQALGLEVPDSLRREANKQRHRRRKEESFAADIALAGQQERSVSNITVGADDIPVRLRRNLRRRGLLPDERNLIGGVVVKDSPEVKEESDNSPSRDVAAAEAAAPRSLSRSASRSLYRLAAPVTTSGTSSVPKASAAAVSAAPKPPVLHPTCKSVAPKRASRAAVGQTSTARGSADLPPPPVPPTRRRKRGDRGASPEPAAAVEAAPVNLDPYSADFSGRAEQVANRRSTTVEPRGRRLRAWTPTPAPERRHG